MKRRNREENEEDEEEEDDEVVVKDYNGSQRALQLLTINVERLLVESPINDLQYRDGEWDGSVYIKKFVVYSTRPPFPPVDAAQTQMRSIIIQHRK